MIFYLFLSSKYRSLPSWSALQVVRARRNSGKNEAETYEDSPEEIKQRSAKETEILTGNLGDAIITSQEILTDPTQMRNLALLHESLVIISLACIVCSSTLIAFILGMVCCAHQGVFERYCRSSLVGFSSAVERADTLRAGERL